MKQTPWRSTWSPMAFAIKPLFKSGLKLTAGT